MKKETHKFIVYPELSSIINCLDICLDMKIKYSLYGVKMLIDHLAIIVSSNVGIDFYKRLGFEIVSHEDRGYDQLVYMSDGMTTLEIYIDSKHPARATKPEALGLRHLGFKTEDIERIANIWHAEIKEDIRGRFCFIYDPDGLPIEIRERVPKAPKEI